MSRRINIKLKKCPFCGNTEIISEWINFNNKAKEPYDWYVGCQDCDIGFMEDTRELAENRWNNRKGE